jgi:hypothetical protein
MVDVSSISHCARTASALRLIRSIKGESVSRSDSFQKRSQLFIGMHNEPLSIVAMCVNNPDHLPFTIHG